MKIIKWFLVGTLSITLMFTSVSCTSSSVLNDLVRVTNNIENDYDSLNNEGLTSVDTINESLNMIDESNSIISLSLTILTETEPNKFILFNELRHDLISLHGQIINYRDIIKSNAESIRSKAWQIRDNDYVLLEDDEAFIKEQISVLKANRELFNNTKGMGLERIYSLRDEMTRDNLDVIINTFQEVKTVLENRLEILQGTAEVMVHINDILDDYMEN